MSEHETLTKIKEMRKSHSDEAELHFQKGRCLEDAMDIEAAIDAFARAAALDPHHVDAFFRQAYWHDLRGNDDKALECYEKAAAITPARANVLLNLGLLYEDRGEYEKAAHVFNRVTAADPTNERARMYAIVSGSTGPSGGRVAIAYSAILPSSTNRHLA